ncbi:MAG TPA: preprotein translocase subunit SecE [Micromonosporaceae bacterium]
MADRNRRGEDAADDRLDDESFDDTVDGDEPASRGGTATRARSKAAESAESRSTAKKDEDRVGIFGRVARFIREVVAELRKVIWPTRKELLTYTAVVVVFVAAIMAIVVGLDYAFAKGVLWVFGNPS